MAQLFSVTKKQKGPGRPELPKGKARTETLRVRLTVAEKSAVEEAAAQSGNASEWARERLLAGLPVERKAGQ